MPVQKTDLSAKKKKLEEMREREKQLAKELDRHMKKPSSTANTKPARQAGSTTSAATTTKSSSAAARTSSKSTTSKTLSSSSSSVTKRKKSDASNSKSSTGSSGTTTTPRRRKSKDKTLKEPEPLNSGTNQLLFLEDEEEQDIYNHRDANDSGNGTLIDFGGGFKNETEDELMTTGQQQQRNDFSETNPFSSPSEDFLFTSTTTTESNNSQQQRPHFIDDDDLDLFQEVDGNASSKQANPFRDGENNLQDDIIFEEETASGKAGGETTAKKKKKGGELKTKTTTKKKTRVKKELITMEAEQAAEEFHFPDDDDFPENEEFNHNGDIGGGIGPTVDAYNNNHKSHDENGNFPQEKTLNIEEYDQFPEHETEMKAYLFGNNNMSSDAVDHGARSNRKRASLNNPQNNYYDDKEENEDDEKDDDIEENFVNKSQQERIREEIKFDHLRDIETRRQQQSQNLDTSYTASDYEDFVNTSKNLGRSIQSLDDFDDDDENGENSSGGALDDGFKNLSITEKIQLELYEQNQKERELKEIHWSLKRENISNYDSECEDHDDADDSENERHAYDEENDTGHKQSRRDTRSMILEEMEILKEREKELKKNYHWSYQEDPEGGQQEHPAYDSNDEYEAENDFIEEEEEQAAAQNKVSVIDKIQNEIDELEARELELQKKRTQHPVYQPQQQQQKTQNNNNKQQQKKRNVERSLADSLILDDKDDDEDEIGQPGALAKKPIFGSREDLVKFFGTADGEVEEEEDEDDYDNEEATGKSKHPQNKNKKTKEKKNTLRIPPVFKRMEEVAIQKKQQQEQQQKQQQQKQLKRQFKTTRNSNNPQTMQQENQQRRPKTINMQQANRQQQQQHQAENERGRSQSFIKSQIKQESFTSYDGTDQAKKKKGQKTTNNNNIQTNVNIRPITRQWEQRGEEEKMKKLRIEREIQQKKEEYLKLLEEKTRIEKNERRQQEKRIQEYEEKERERQLMKQKKQGLNQLWLSGKALVTVDDDSDVNDEELLPQYQQQEQHITLKQKVSHKDVRQQKNKQQQKQQRRQQTPANNKQQGRGNNQPILINKTIQRWEKIIAKNT